MKPLHHAAETDLFLKLRGPSPQALILIEGAWFFARRLRNPFFGEVPMGTRHFWEFLGYVHSSGPIFKKYCAVLARLVSHATNNIFSLKLQLRELWWGLLRSGQAWRLVGTIISRSLLVQMLGRPSIHVTRSRVTHSSIIKELITQVLTLLEGARFNPWCLSRSFWGNTEAF